MEGGKQLLRINSSAGGMVDCSHQQQQATMRHIAPLLAAMGLGLRNRGFDIRASISRRPVTKVGWRGQSQPFRSL
jgi:hypothetical protein